MDKKKRNKNAGSHPSYKKRKMSAESIRKKRERDKKYHATPERKKYRAELNKARRKAKKAGKVKKGQDMSHTKSGKIVAENRKTNRARNGEGKGGKRISTKK